MAKIIKWRLNWSCCLGPIICLRKNAPEIEQKHEQGHYAQFKKFWLLYYIIVGIPSIFRWVMCYFKFRDSKWYYSGWPENDADKRGGVSR